MKELKNLSVVEVQTELFGSIPMPNYILVEWSTYFKDAVLPHVLEKTVPEIDFDSNLFTNFQKNDTGVD